MAALPKSNFPAMEAFADEEMQLVRELRLLNVTSAHSLVRHLAKQRVEIHRRDLVVAKAVLIDLLVLTSRVLMEVGADREHLLPAHLHGVASVLLCEEVSRLPDLVDSAFSSYVAGLKPQVGNQLSPPIRAVLDYVQKHFRQSDLSLRPIAQAVFLNHTYLSRRFHQETGLTLTHYVTRVRLKAAQDYLRSTDMGVAEVAAAVGYCDASHFSRLFQRFLSASPSSFRNQCRRAVGVADSYLCG